MKTFAKVMVVFACIFLVGGIALFAVGYVGGGGKEVLNALIISDDDFTYMEQTAEGDFATLSVDTSVSSIEFVLGEDEQFKFQYWLYKGDEDRFDTGDGTVSLKIDKAKKWYLHIFPLMIYPAEKSKVTVTVPASFAGAINAVTDVGAIRITDFTGLESVTLGTDTGAVSAEKLTVRGSVRLTSSTGALNCTDVKAAAFEIQSDVGALKHADLEAEGKLTAHTDTGAIHAERVTAAEIDAESDVGALKLMSAKAERFTCKTGTGSINLDILGARSEYRVETEVGVGKAYVDGVSAGSGILNPDAHSSVYAKSSVGSIEIRFSA